MASIKYTGILNTSDTAGTSPTIVSAAMSVMAVWHLDAPKADIDGNIIILRFTKDLEFLSELFLSFYPFLFSNKKRRTVRSSFSQIIQSILTHLVT